MATIDLTHALIERSRRKIRAYELSRDDWNSARTVTRLLEQTKREYEERFLYELIQNGYDAHEAGDTEGEVSILFDEAEDDGVLYVSNRGRPFTEADVEAICELAQSNKDPRESIGNKGVGFKSVLRICAWPEIYSARVGDGDGEAFSGWCFGFAKPADVLNMVDGDEERAARVAEDVSPYFLPMPLIAQPPRVRAFARAGMSTVIRLPVRSPEAADVVRRRLAELIETDVPVQLFLDRLRRLGIEVEGRSDDRVVELTRAAEAIAAEGVGSVDNRQAHELVDLGHQGRWFVARRTVPVEAVRAAIGRSIEQGGIEESWREWDRETSVAVAVRVDGAEVAPRAYTFLPMGEAASAPLHGHLHAPFSTKLARTAVDVDIPYNELLVRQAVEAGIRAVVAFANRPEVLPDAALVDLLAWQHPYEADVADAFTTLGYSAAEAEVPIVPDEHGVTRGSLATVSAWDDHALSFVTAERLATWAGAHVLAPTIAGPRRRRLDVFAKAIVGAGLEPGARRRAGWLETVGAEMHTRRMQPLTWDRFYGDVATVMADDAALLRGRTILLGADGKLHPVPGGDEASPGTLRPLVFFAPARSRTDSDEEVDAAADISVPKTLRSTLVQMHDGLIWTRRDGSRNVHTPARRFLEDQRLVRGYKAADLLEHIGRVLESRFTEARGRDALSYAFRIHRAARQLADADLRRAALRVPTATGWVPAGHGVFGGAWGTAVDPVLDELIDDPTAGAELRALGERRLLPPGAWEHPEDIAAFRSFLERVGVRDGLWPEPRKTSTEETARALESWPQRTNRGLGLPDDVVARWRARVEEDGEVPSYASGQYRLTRPVAVVPGLGGHSKLGPSAKQAFARLLVAGIAQWSGDALVLRWTRRTGYADTVTWPAPLAVALEETPWVPVVDPESPDEGVFVRPHEAWHFAEARGDDAPRFSPLLDRALRHDLDTDREALKALAGLGLRQWEEPRDAARLLEHLAVLVSSGRGQDAAHALRRSCEEAWRRLLGGADVEPPSTFVVSRAGSLGTWNGTDNDALVVDTGTSPLVRSLVELTDRAVLVAGRENGGRIVEALHATLGERVTTLDDLEVGIFASGTPVRPSRGEGWLLLDDLSWMRDVVPLVIETRGSRFVRFGDAGRRRIRELLERVRVRRVDAVEVVVAGHGVELPRRLHSVLPLPDVEAPTLLLLDEAAGLRPSDLTAALTELLQAPVLAEPLQNVLLRLERMGVDVPSTDDLASALEIDAASVEAARAHLSGSASALALLLAPVVAVLAGLNEARALQATAATMTTEAEVGAVVARALGDDAEAVRLLTAARRTPLPAALRDELGLDFVAFNEARVGLGSEPLGHPEDHEQAVRHAVARDGARIADELRRRWLGRFRAGADLTRYIDARSLGGITPDPAWLDRYARPPKDAVDARIAAWLDDVAGPPPGEPSEGLPPLEATRKRNREALLGVVDRVRLLALAWAEKHGAHDTMWTGGAPADVADAASDEGLFDFDVLDEMGAVACVKRLGLLPEGLPATTDLAELGLTGADLVAARAAKRREEDDRQRRRRSIVLDGEELEVTEASYAAIAGRVRGELGHGVLSRTRRMTPLAELPALQAPGAAGGGGEKGRNLRRVERLTPAQRSAIGLAGEVAAYEWLAQTYPDEFTPSCWRSSYCAVDGIPGGSDDLGYDFALVLKTKTVYFEVKATMGGLTEFEMGDSEVKRARACTGRGRTKEEYRVLFVSHVLDSRRRRLDILPNPLDPAFRTFYRFPGAGLRCLFQPA